MFTVHPVVAIIAVLAVDRPSSETLDAGGDAEDGKRPEGRLDCDRDQENATAVAVITLPGRAVTFISRLGCRLSARNRSPRPRRCPSRPSQPEEDD